MVYIYIYMVCMWNIYGINVCVCVCVCVRVRVYLVASEETLELYAHTHTHTHAQRHTHTWSPARRPSSSSRGINPGLRWLIFGGNTWRVWSHGLRPWDLPPFLGANLQQCACGNSILLAKTGNLLYMKKKNKKKPSYTTHTLLHVPSRRDRLQPALPLT